MYKRVLVHVIISIIIPLILSTAMFSVLNGVYVLVEVSIYINKNDMVHA